MRKPLLILLIIGLLFISLYVFVVYDEMNYQEEISELYDHDPKNFNFSKPIEYLDFEGLDSLRKLEVQTDKIEVVGTGYSGYDFYIWHKPVEKGVLYLKVFELTKNNQISKQKVTARTKKLIDSIKNDFVLFESTTVIDEGTFEKYYPVRFELWFKSNQTKKVKLLTEKKYLIDGWDR
jgi:hypothetical protein